MATTVCHTSTNNNPPAEHDYAGRLEALRARIDNLENRDWAPCNCPEDCPGPGCRRGKPPGTPPGLRVPSPARARDGTLHPVVNLRGGDREKATVLAEARGAIHDLPLPRLGNRTGTLRMSLQVHDDPNFQYRTRLGYYGELYFRVGKEKERHIGMIEAWRITKSSGVHPDGMRDWVAEWLQEKKTSLGGYEDNNVMWSLFRVFDIEGQPQEDAKEASPKLYERLSDEDSDIVFISMAHIKSTFSGNRLLGHAFKLFYRLLTGGVLPAFYNIEGPTTVLLEPGCPTDDRIKAMWVEQYPRPYYMTDREWYEMIKKKLIATYERNGYECVRPKRKAQVMGIIIDSVPRDREDRLMMPPDVPPLGTGAYISSSERRQMDRPAHPPAPGDTSAGSPPARVGRGQGHGQGVQKPSRGRGGGQGRGKGTQKPTRGRGRGKPAQLRPERMSM